MVWIKNLSRVRLLVTTIGAGTYLALPSCGDSTFSSGTSFSGGNRTKTELTPNLREIVNSKLLASFKYSFEGQIYTVSGEFLPKNPKPSTADNAPVEFSLNPASIKSDANSKFPAEMADRLLKSKISATVSKASSDKPWSVSFKVLVSDLKINEQIIGTKTLDLKSAAATPSWEEKPIEVASSQQTSNTSADCKLNDSGNAVSGYFTIVTTPAPCEFKLPTVRVGMRDGKLGEVPIGTFWLAAASLKVAHSFPYLQKVEEMPKETNDPSKTLNMDNGFILIEPSGKTYLLADAGSAVTDRSNHKKTEDIAKTILAQKFPGAAFQGLLKPVSGSKANNYADSTVFQKGSVIALYDDTPDMAGKVDVGALTEALRTSGLALEWSAQLVKK